ncbi:hypothetical protein RJ640_029862 [Escallonia rubra]|uniref:Uncharacterized protein n=1 Tax=Escallonia rubra TaxID=112253 RepID=A0AA88QJR9_9ASTE|nr:hypothetical protein RJ640_029862 [Escallonia rubra]
MAAAAAAAATGRAFLISRSGDSYLKPPPAYSNHLLIRPLIPAIAATKRRTSTVVSCLISGVDGGGVSDDFVSTRKSGFDREFSVIANMLRRIEPLDNSVISKGVSDSAKDSMKQTISTMLGYTLWNVEYRLSLMRNFDISPNALKILNFPEEDEASEAKHEGGEGGEILRNINPWVPLMNKQEENMFQELQARKQEAVQMEHIRESNNDLLKYLRSLDSDMVMELSRPSSLEVDEVIHQLVQDILQGFFKEDTPSDIIWDSAIRGQENYEKINDEFCDTIGTSRDYLAKLLFWCMLLGHHLRGLENRVHLSCAVGLL